MTLRPSDWAWIGLALGVAAWDATCSRDEMLSDASVRYMSAHPVITSGVIVYLAAHLMGVVPHRIDPLGGIGSVLRAVANGLRPLGRPVAPAWSF